MSTLLQVQFQGVDEGSNPKSLPPGTLLVANNCSMDKGRRLRKRRGTVPLAKTNLFIGGFIDYSITAGTRLQSRGTDLALIGDPWAYSHSSDLNGFMPQDRPPVLSMTRRALVDTTRSATAATTVIYGDLLVTAFTSGGTSTAGALLYLQVENVTTGAKLVPPFFVANSTVMPRLLISGSVVYLVWGDTSGNILLFDFDLTTRSTVTGTRTLATDARTATGPVLDAAITTPTGSGVLTIFVAYGMQAAVGGKFTRIRGFVVSSLAAVSTDNFYHGIAATLCVAIDANPTRVAVVLSDTSSGTRLVTYSSALVVNLDTVITGGYCLAVSVVFSTVSTVLVSVVSGNSAAALPQYYRTSLISAVSHTEDSDSPRKTYHAQGMSKPFLIRSRWYAFVTFFPRDYSLASTSAIPSASTVLVEIQTGFQTVESVANASHTLAGNGENQTGWTAGIKGDFVSQPCVHTSGAIYAAVAYRNREPTNLQSIPLGWNLYRVVAGEGDIHRLAIVGAGGLAAAGAPYWTDGQSAKAYGFVHAPQIVSLTNSAGGDAARAAGDYFYIAVYEWRDANGVLHRSAPSPPKSTTILVGQQTAVKVSTSSLSFKDAPPGDIPANPVSIAIYRTTVGGATYYRLTLEPAFQVLINDPTVGDVTLADTKADADIADANPPRALNVQPELYTGPSGTGGELADIPPPSFISVATHKGRLVGIDGTLRSVAFSKDQTQDPMVAPGFNEALVLSFATDKTALASVSETLVVFGPGDIDIVHGDGPDATGNSGAWQIQRVQSDVGCVNPKSIATTPMGAVFESPRGIELFSTGLAVQWIGKAVEDTLAAFPIITSATLCAADHEVRWTCNKADGSSGLVLAWDFLNKFWFTRTYADTADTLNASVAFVDARLIDGVYTMLTAGGQIYQETTAHHLDGGTAWVTMDIQMAWMSPAGGPAAWHRIKDVTVIGTPVTPHVLEVSHARDYATSWEQVKTFAEGSLVTTPGANSKARVTFANQKCQAARVRIRDLAPAAPDYGTGEGPMLEGLAFRVGIKSGPVKTAAGEQG